MSLETFFNKDKRKRFLKCFFRKFVSSLVAVIFIIFSLYIPDAFGQLSKDPLLNTPYAPMSIKDMEKLVILKDNGSIKEVHQGPNGKFIIHIQDAHVNYKGQKNLAKILKDLIERYGINLVLVEGGEGNASLSFLRHFATKEWREKVAEKYLKKGKIAGEEYLDIISEPKPRFHLYGIEDKHLYKSNLNQFLKIDKFTNEANDFIDSLEKALKILKEKFYSEELKDLERKGIAYDKENLDIVSYCKYLSQIASSPSAPRNDKLALSLRPRAKRGGSNLAFLQIDTLLSVNRLERLIDFEKVNTERDNFITLLSKKLSKERLNTLLKMSVDFKSDIISPATYYIYIKGISREADIDIRKYPNLHIYIYYIKLFEDIDREGLFKELSALEDKTQDALYKNDMQRNLGRITKDLNLIENFVNLRLSPDDFREYQSRKRDFNSKKYSKFINDLAKKYKLPEAFVYHSRVLDKNFQNLEEFYKIAKKRDKAFFKNAIKIMEEKRQRQAVLIAGGFHTDHLMPLFKDKGYSYIVVTPNVTQSTDMALYRSLIKGELTPEEKVLKAVLGLFRPPGLLPNPSRQVTLEMLVREIVQRRPLPELEGGIAGLKDQLQEREILVSALARRAAEALPPELENDQLAHEGGRLVTKRQGRITGEFLIDKGEWRKIGRPRGMGANSDDEEISRLYREVDFYEGIRELRGAEAEVASLIYSKLIEAANKKLGMPINIFLSIPKGRLTNREYDSLLWVAPVFTGEELTGANYYIALPLIERLAREWEIDESIAREIVDVMVNYHELTHVLPVDKDILIEDGRVVESHRRALAGGEEEIGVEEGAVIQGASRIDEERIDDLLRSCGIDRIEGVDLENSTYNGRYFDKEEVIVWITGWDNRQALAKNIARYMYAYFVLVGNISDEDGFIEAIKESVTDPPRGLDHNFFWLNSRFYKETFAQVLEYARSLLRRHNVSVEARKERLSGVTSEGKRHGMTPKDRGRVSADAESELMAKIEYICSNLPQAMRDNVARRLSLLADKIKSDSIKDLAETVDIIRGSSAINDDQRRTLLIRYAFKYAYAPRENTSYYQQEVLSLLGEAEEISQRYTPGPTKDSVIDSLIKADPTPEDITNIFKNIFDPANFNLPAGIEIRILTINSGLRVEVTNHNKGAKWKSVMLFLDYLFYAARMYVRYADSVYISGSGYTRETTEDLELTAGALDSFEMSHKTIKGYREILIRRLERLGTQVTPAQPWPWSKEGPAPREGKRHGMAPKDRSEEGGEDEEGREYETGKSTAAGRAKPVSKLRQLSDEERRELAERLRATSADIASHTIGFGIRGSNAFSSGAVVAMIPSSLEDADVSVCGVKGFMIDERRRFTRADGSVEEVDCAAVATLDIIDSPVHVHGNTQELYVILEGNGTMILGDELVKVAKGNVILIPPMIEHGLVSDTGDPVKVLLTFTPGLAPKDIPEFRDEKIIYERASERVKGISANASAAGREGEGGYHFRPKYNFVQWRTLDPSIIKTQRTGDEVIEILKAARERGIGLSISGHLRGVDGPGSSLDLPEFQRSLTEIGMARAEELPSTPTIASEFGVTIRFELADDPEVIEYIAPDYGITEDNPYGIAGEVVLTPEGRTPNGQRDAPAYIFRNLFGLKGIRIICESVSPMALAGGMESSNVFNVALIAAASILSGADLSYADIFNLAVKIENDEFGSITGGQGHLSCIIGGAYRHTWLSGMKDIQGNLINPYSAFSEPLLSDEELSSIEEHMMLVQAGKEYVDGRPVVGRTATLINNMWTDLLRDRDRVGLPLHQEKLGLARRYTQALKEGDYTTVIETINRYVDIRDELCPRWLNLTLDAREGRSISYDGQPLPEYAYEYKSKVFDENHPEYGDYDVVRDAYREHGEALRRLSLYTLNPIAHLVREARREGIAIMPLGAGGPGANLIAVSSKGESHLRSFFESQGLSELTEEYARRIIHGTGTLKGYMPFRAGKDPLRVEGFSELGLEVPRLPVPVSAVEAVGLVNGLEDEGPVGRGGVGADRRIEFPNMKFREALELKDSSPEKAIELFTEAKAEYEALIREGIDVEDARENIRRINEYLEELVIVSPDILMVETDYKMRMLGIGDYRRVVQIYRTSLNPVAFVEELMRLTGKPENVVLGVLNAIPFFRPTVASYRVRKTESFDQREFMGKELEARVTPEGYEAMGELPDVESQPLSEYLRLMREGVQGVPFVFRDEMERFVGRFLGLPVSEEEMSKPDLLDIIDKITEFLRGIDLAQIEYVVTSGIGANEMYSHQLAYILNNYFERAGISVRWIVVNNPAHLGVIPQDANNENTLVFEMSRSGGTKETVDFFNATRDRFKRRIIAANKGNLKESAEELAEESGANILIIDDTPGDIGGRQMNRKTLMVYAPLYVALATGLEDASKAKALLGWYTLALFKANEDLAYRRGLESPSVRLAEFLFRQRESGRVNFSLVYNESLRAAAKEAFQLLNEGANKNIAGGTNNNILNTYSLENEGERYERVFSLTGESQMPIFLLDENEETYERALERIEELRKRGIPYIIISVAIRKGAERVGDLEENLQAIARTSALLQDTVVYFTYLTNQDANSNPAVKFVREITAAMFDILKTKKASGAADIRMTFEDVIAKIEERERVAEERARGSIDERNIQGGSYRAEFDEFRGAISALSRALGLPEAKVASALIRTISKEVAQTDIGEAAGANTQEIREAFGRSIVNNLLGLQSPAPEAAPLKEQIVLRDSEGIRVSVAGKKGAERRSASGNLAEQLAEYLYTMYKERSEGLLYMPLTYMEVDSGDPIIGNIVDTIIDKFGDLGITVPLLGLPGAAHTGIEAVMSHPESIFNIAIIYTDTYGEGLGTKAIEEGVTVDNATYIYGIGNVIRMVLGGSPSIIFEVKDSSDLEFVKGVLQEALTIARNKIEEHKGTAGITKQGQRIWIDGVDREFIRSEEGLRAFIQRYNVSGITTNPTLYNQAFENPIYREEIERLAREGKSDEEIYRAIVAQDAREALDVVRELGVEDFKFSIELNPKKAEEVGASIEEAEEWISEIGEEYKERVMFKVVATEAGYQIIERLTAKGINVNATLIFSPEQYEKVTWAYVRGIELALEAGIDISKIYSVASFFISRWDVALKGKISQALYGKVANAIVRLAYNTIFKRVFTDRRFRALEAKGARRQDFLLASTGSKWDKFREELGEERARELFPEDIYITPNIGQYTVNTLPQKSIVSFDESGKVIVRPTIEGGISEAREVIGEAVRQRVDLEQEAEKIFRNGLESFRKDYNSIFARIHSIAEPVRQREEEIGEEEVISRLTEVVLEGLITVVERSPLFITAPQEVKDKYLRTNPRERLREGIQVKMAEQHRRITEALPGRPEEEILGIFEIEAIRYAGVQEAAARLLEALPVPEENMTVTHYVPKTLYDLDRTLWDRIVYYLNLRAGRSDAYKIVPMNLSDLDTSTPEHLASGILARLNTSSRNTAVLYLPDTIILNLGSNQVPVLSERATLVSYEDQLQGRLVFAEGLLAYGEGLRNIKEETLLNDILAYGTLLSDLYKGITGGLAFDRESLESIYDNPYGFLMEAVVRFPKITPELHRWIMEYQKERVIEAITELAV